MPRRYHSYPAEFQVLHVLSSAGASILGVGLMIPLIYFVWSLKSGALAPADPWLATGLEWRVASPPPTENFRGTPVVTWNAYEFRPVEETRVVGRTSPEDRPDVSGDPPR
jgi:cytochrome c oxidase subunit 1